MRLAVPRSPRPAVYKAFSNCAGLTTRKKLMANIVLLFACLIIGMVLHRTGKLPANAPATINGFIIHVSLPALILWYIHGVDLRQDLLGAVAMPWLLFVISAVVFWYIGKRLRLSRGSTGALIM